MPVARLKDTHPVLWGELHVEQEPGIDPERLTKGGKASPAWLCDNGHRYVARVSHRVDGSGCPYCSGRLALPGVNDLETKHPDLASEWHPTENGTLLPSQVTALSGMKAWWKCATCSYVWHAVIGNRSGLGRGCPQCAGKVVHPGKNDFATVHPELAEEWVSAEKGATPTTVLGRSNVTVLWRCRVCAHEWRAQANARAAGKGCPGCSGRAVVAGKNDLQSQNPLLASQWHPTKNGRLKPSEVTQKSAYEAWWLGACGHEWLTSVRARNGVISQNCPFCAGQRILVGFNDLQTRRPDVAATWDASKNDGLTPEMVTVASSRFAWWKCPAGHSTYARVADRTRSDQIVCSTCRDHSYASRGEKEIGAWLVNLIGTANVMTSVRSVIKGELDIYIPSKNVAIEFNGIYWHSEAAGRDARYHHDKWAACKEKGIQLIQVWEDEWNRNPEQVKKMLAHKLSIQLPGEKRVMARKTQVVEVTKAQAEAFLNENHVQGYAAGSYYLGLVEPGDIETLLAVLVLKKEAGTEGKALNIIRYATAASVPGGFTKLLKHAERTYAPESFITFSDHCVSDGGLYRNNGFVADKELKPDYMYVVRNERKHKFGYRLKRFRDDPALQYEDGMTERELAQLNGLPRIWDAGKTRWTKTVTAEL